MSGISSKAAGTLQNKLKYNGKEEQRQEFSDGSGLEWLDYGARMYDNQIGRWMTVDPMAEKYNSLTPYNYCGNIPTFFTDPDGRDILGETDEDRKFILDNLTKVFGENQFKFNGNKLEFIGKRRKIKGEEKKEILDGVLGIIGDDKIQFKITKNVSEQEKIGTINPGNGEVTDVSSLDEKGVKHPVGYVGDDDKKYTSLTFGKFFVYLNQKTNTSLTFEEEQNNLPDYQLLSPPGVKLLAPKRNPDGSTVNLASPTVTRFFHSIGHVLYDGQAQNKVITYENVVRGLLKMPLKYPQDYRHTEKSQ